MQRQDVDESKIQPYNPLTDPILTGFLKFWETPLEDKIIPDILAGKCSLLYLRFLSGPMGVRSKEHLEKDKEVLQKYIKSLEEISPAKRSGAEWGLLGLCYAICMGDGEKSLACFQQGAKLNDPLSLYGPSYLEFYGFVGNKTDNDENLNIAANRHYGLALEFLGYREKNPKQAQAYLEEAGAQGVFTAYLQLAWKYAEDKRAEDEKNTHVQAASIGSIASMVALADMYLKESGLSRDSERASAYYRHAIEYDVDIGQIHQFIQFFREPWCTLQAEPAFYYHRGLLIDSPIVKVSLIRWKDFDMAEKQFKLLATTYFPVFDRLSDADPWEKVARVLNDPKLSDNLLQQKIAHKVQQLLPIALAMYATSTDIFDVEIMRYINKLMFSMHKSYQPIILQNLKKEIEKSLNLGEKTCLALREILEPIRVELRASLQTQLNKMNAHTENKDEAKNLAEQMEKINRIPKAHITPLEESAKKTFSALAKIASLQQHLETTLMPEKKITGFRNELNAIKKSSTTSFFPQGLPGLDDQMLTKIESILNQYDQEIEKMSADKAKPT